MLLSETGIHLVKIYIHIVHPDKKDRKFLRPISYIRNHIILLEALMITPSSDITAEMTEVLHEKMEKSRILVVDDEPDVNFTLKITLEDKGFKVDAFDDPLLALENFKAGLYDLVILDIKMPKMNGFELFREIKKIDNNVKVCFLTALNELHDYQPFRKEVFPKAGERYFIQKPIESEEMIKRVNEMMMTHSSKEI